MTSVSDRTLVAVISIFLTFITVRALKECGEFNKDIEEKKIKEVNSFLSQQTSDIIQKWAKT